MTHAVELCDTTLRDGTQAENFNLSVEDKIRITASLDKLGIDYIEGGWPGSNPLSVDYFKRVLAALRNIFGGNVQSFETLLDRARREAILRLKESCSDADEIINLRIETSSISKGGDNKIGCVEVLAYGTAIYYTQ